MNNPAVKTVKEYIIWRFTKIIASSDGDVHEEGFIQKTYEKLKSMGSKWLDEFPEDTGMSSVACVFCEDDYKVKEKWMIPHRACNLSKKYNCISVCEKCREKKGAHLIKKEDVDSTEKMLPSLRRKILKMLYICHECNGTLDKEIGPDAKMSDLTYVFDKPCDSKKVGEREWGKAVGMNANYTKFIVGTLFAIIALIIAGIFASKVIQVGRVEYEEFTENLNKVYRNMPKDDFVELFDIFPQKDHFEAGNIESFTYLDYSTEETGDTITFKFRNDRLRKWGN